MTRLTEPDPFEDSPVRGRTAEAEAWEDPRVLAEQLLPVLLVMQKRLARSVDQHALALGPPTVSQMRALLCLLDHDALPVGELAELLELSRSATTELIDRMVERGMVTREPNPADRRQVMVSLTPKAREKSDQARRYRLDGLVRVISSLRQEERTGFVRGMIRLAGELQPDDQASCAANGTQTTNAISPDSEGQSHD